MNFMVQKARNFSRMDGFWVGFFLSHKQGTLQAWLLAHKTGRIGLFALLAHFPAFADEA
jgi:hypothetical protein